MRRRLRSSPPPSPSSPPPAGGVGPPPPPPTSSMMSSSSGNAVVAGMMTISILRTLFSGLAFLDHLLRREVLRHQIFGHIRHAEFVGPTIHHRIARAKIIAGRRRGDAPFKCGGAPGIAVQNFFAAEKAPQEIDKEESLRENGKENRDGDESVNRRTRHSDGSQRAAGRNARMRDQAEPVHGHEHAIDAGECNPEMNLAERFVQAAAKKFGEPEKQGAKNGERRRHAHDQMEMAGDEIVADGSGGEIEARQENPGESAGKKKGNETERRKHGGADAY